MLHDDFIILKKSLKDGNSITDEELCRMAAGGITFAEELLAERYSKLVRICARRLFLAGGDFEDLIQEGMLGLVKAIREYDPSKETSFKTYAEVCVRNRLFSTVRSAAALKNTPLNDYVPLDLSHTELPSPENTVIEDEGKNELEQLIKDTLSGLESRVLALYLEGRSYSEIAETVSKPVKSVDNAVQRIRRKLSEHFSKA